MRCASLRHHTGSIAISQAKTARWCARLAQLRLTCSTQVCAFAHAATNLTWHATWQSNSHLLADAKLFVLGAEGRHPHILQSSFLGSDFLFAGVYDRYFEASIEQSYGRLSFAPLVIDSSPPFLLRDKGTSFGFHNDQSVAYLQDSLGVKTDGSQYFLIHVHAPLYQGRSPMVCTFYSLCSVHREVQGTFTCPSASTAAAVASQDASCATFELQSAGLVCAALDQIEPVFFCFFFWLSCPSFLGCILLDIAAHLQAHAWAAGLDQPIIFFMHCNPDRILVAA